MSKGIGGLMKGLGGKSGGLPTHAIIVVVTISAEELASFFMFECPCDTYNGLYGFMVLNCLHFTYLFGPAFLLFLAGIGVQGKYWRLITGLFKRRRVNYSSANMAAHANKPTTDCDKCRIFCKTLIKCMMLSIPAPLAWMMVGLLRGEHATCGYWPTDIEDYPSCYVNTTVWPLPCQIPRTYDETDLIVEGCAGSHARNLRAWSHLIAWGGIVLMLIAGLLIVSINACGSAFTFHQKTFIGNYKKAEDKIMKEQLALRADALAGECVEEFLTTRRSKEQWDRVSLMQDKMIKLDAKDEGKHFIYTPLHGLISEEMAKTGKTAFDLISSDSDSSSSSDDDRDKKPKFKRQKKTPA